MLPQLSLVLGGAASGKSAYAENLVLQSGHKPVYIATAQLLDDEMAQKVTRHQLQRGNLWQTYEVPYNVADTLDQFDADEAVLIDCATLWLTNIILDDRDLVDETNDLLAALGRCKAPVVVVSNETGQGIVPENALARKFRNAQGTLNQQIASRAEFVVAIMAGLPMALKGQMP